MAKASPQPTPGTSANKAPHVYELIVQQHQTLSPSPTQNEIIITFGGSAFYTYPYRTE